MIKKSLATVALISIAACGGGSSGSSSGGVTPGNPGPAASHTQSTKLTISFPAKGTATSSSARIKPAYVSPNAANLQVIINSVNGNTTLPSAIAVVATTNIPLTTSGTNPPCTISAGTETCTGTIPAPTGTVSYTFNIEDSSADILSTATQSFLINAGVANTGLAVTLEGIVKTVTLALPTLDAGTSSAGAIVVSALDASGATIVGSANYDNAITISDNDPSGATSLSLNSGAGASSIVSTIPTDTVTLNYSGLAIGPGNVISASGSGITTDLNTFGSVNNVINLTGTDVSVDEGAGDVNYGVTTIYFGQTSGTESFTASELGWTNSPYNMGFTIVAGAEPSLNCSSPSAVMTVAASGSPATMFNVTANGTAGICPVDVTDGVGQYTTLYVSVTGASIGVTGKRKH